MVEVNPLAEATEMLGSMESRVGAEKGAPDAIAPRSRKRNPRIAAVPLRLSFAHPSSMECGPTATSGYQGLALMSIVDYHF